MSKPIISLQTRIAFRENFSNNGVLQTIRDAFDGVGIRCDSSFIPSSDMMQRRTLVEQYYSTINWEDHAQVKCVINIFENELHKLLVGSDSSCREQDQNNKREAEKLIRLLKKDGFEWCNNELVEFNNALKNLSAIKVDGEHIQRQIQRMRESVETDPSLAIGTAKELIETTCKTILEERGSPVVGNPDIPKLTKAVLEELSLVPEGVEEKKSGADAIKRILRSLGTIGNDLAQLRGLYGSGHGPAAKTKTLTSRHANLAVGAAATFATFLFATHEERQND